VASRFLSTAYGHGARRSVTTSAAAVNPSLTCQNRLNAAAQGVGGSGATGTTTPRRAGADPDDRRPARPRSTQALTLRDPLTPNPLRVLQPERHRCGSREGFCQRWVAPLPPKSYSFFAGQKIRVKRFSGRFPVEDRATPRVLCFKYGSIIRATPAAAWITREARSFFSSRSRSAVVGRLMLSRRAVEPGS
jgi:hypothetical protein